MINWGAFTIVAVGSFGMGMVIGATKWPCWIQLVSIVAGGVVWGLFTGIFGIKIWRDK